MGVAHPCGPWQMAQLLRQRGAAADRDGVLRVSSSDVITTFDILNRAAATALRRMPRGTPAALQIASQIPFQLQIGLR